MGGLSCFVSDVHFFFWHVHRAKWKSCLRILRFCLVTCLHDLPYKTTQSDERSEVMKVSHMIVTVKYSAPSSIGFKQNATREATKPLFRARANK